MRLGGTQAWAEAEMRQLLSIGRAAREMNALPSWGKKVYQLTPAYFRGAPEVREE